MYYVCVGNLIFHWHGGDRDYLFFPMTPETLAWESCSALPITSVVLTRDVLLQRKWRKASKPFDLRHFVYLWNTEYKRVLDLMWLSKSKVDKMQRGRLYFSFIASFSHTSINNNYLLIKSQGNDPSRNCPIIFGEDIFWNESCLQCMDFQWGLKRVKWHHGGFHSAYLEKIP